MQRLLQETGPLWVAEVEKLVFGYSNYEPAQEQVSDGVEEGTV